MNEAPPQSEGYVSKEVIARRLGKTARTIDSYMKFRRIPYIKLGRTVLFDWPMVKAHIDKNYLIR